MDGCVCINVMTKQSNETLGRRLYITDPNYILVTQLAGSVL